MELRQLSFIATHQLVDCLRFVGMRDRCRCPMCKAVGTFKAHGGWFDESRDSGRRFLCKWCGYYKGQPFNKGPVVVKQARVVPSKGCWRLMEWDNDPHDESYVPKDVVQCNPWRG